MLGELLHELRQNQMMKSMMMTIACKKEEYDFLNEQEYPEEVIIMMATKHAVHAQNQRAYAKERIAEAKGSINNLWADRRFVFFSFLTVILSNFHV